MYFSYDCLMSKCLMAYTVSDMAAYSWLFYIISVSDAALRGSKCFRCLHHCVYLSILIVETKECPVLSALGWCGCRLLFQTSRSSPCSSSCSELYQMDPYKTLQKLLTVWTGRVLDCFDWGGSETCPLVTHVVLWKGRSVLSGAL